MSKGVGIVLILAGLGVASSLLQIGSDVDQASATAEVAGGWSIGSQRIAMVVPIEQPAAGAKSAASPTPQPAKAQATPPVPVVVTVTHRTEQAPPALHSAQRAPFDRASLARDLQRELRRVGCYNGELNGIWTPATRKAMKAFTDRVNATLPVEDPDHILLTLIQTHNGAACGKPCPASQGLTEDGRCLPTAVLAHAAKNVPPSTEATSGRGKEPAETARPAITGWTTTTSAVVRARPQPEPAPTGRMALAGPSIEPLPAAAAPPGPTSATATRNKQAGADRRPPRAASQERRVHVERPVGRSSRHFVESVLRNRSSLN